jgi:hypothetical protein
VEAGHLKKLRVGKKYSKERFSGKYMAGLMIVVYGVSGTTMSSTCYVVYGVSGMTLSST